MRKSTRLIALLMTLIMLVGMMPFSTFAVPSSSESDHSHGDSGSTYTGESVSSSDLTEIQNKVEAAGGTLTSFQNFESMLDAKTDYALLAPNEGALTIASMTGGTFGTWKSWVKAMAYERKDGNVALKFFNSTEAAPTGDDGKVKGTDTFLTVSAGAAKGKNFVFSFDYKQTGPRSNGWDSEILFGARHDGFRNISLLKITKAGEIKSGLIGDKVLGYANGDTFTTIAVRGDLAANKAYFYVNGVMVGEATLFTEAWLADCTKGAGSTITKENINLEAFRVFQSNGNAFPTDGNGLYLDNILLYTGESGKTLKYIYEDTDPVTGFCEADGKVYYINNNNRVAGTTYTVNGAKYKFNTNGEALTPKRTSLVDVSQYLGSDKQKGVVYKESNGLYALRSSSLSSVTFGAGTGIKSATLQDFLNADHIEWNVYTDGIQDNTVLPIYFDFDTAYTYNPTLKEGDDGYMEKKPLNTSANLNFDSKNVVCYGKVVTTDKTTGTTNTEYKKHTYDSPRSVNGWTVISMGIDYYSARLSWTKTNLTAAGKTLADVALADVTFRTGEGWGLGDGKTYANTIYNEDGTQIIVNNDYCIYFTSIDLVSYTNTPATLAELGASGWIKMSNGDEYYFKPWDHTLAKNVTLDIDGTGYTFASDGKLVGKANGVQTVQFGSTHYYKDGVMQKGDANYCYTDGANKYAINQKGEYLGNYYEYKFAKDYAKGTYTRTDYIKSFDFDSLSTGRYLYNTVYTYAGAYTEAKEDYLYTGSGLGANAKGTYSEIVAESGRGNVLHWSNQSTAVDPYLELRMGGTTHTNVALSFDVKLGEDWANTLQLVVPISRENKDNNQFPETLRINKQGYLVFGNNVSILAKLSATEYTNVTLVLRTEAFGEGNKLYADVYVNGAKLIDNEIVFSSETLKFSYINEIRFARFDPSKTTGSLYFDDIYAYALGADETPDNVDTSWTYTGKTGYVTDPYGDGVNYFFGDNGVMLHGEQTDTEGNTYLFDSVTGAAVNGVYTDGYYYDNGKKDTVSTGLTKKGDDYYFFDSDHKVVKNVTKTEGLNRYVIASDGKVTLETVKDSSVLFGAADLKNSGNGTLVYNKNGSELAYSAKLTGSLIMKKDSDIDLSKVGTLRVKMYIPEKFTDSKIMFTLEREDLFYKLEGDLDSGFTSVSTEAIRRSAAIKDSTKVEDKNWTDVVINGASKSVRLIAVTRADGTVDYYKKDYTYYTPSTKIQLGDYKAGEWVTIDLPLDSYNVDGDKGTISLAAISDIALISNWGSTGSKVCYVSEADTDKTVMIESVSIVSYEEMDTENDGIKGDYCYGEGEILTGWQLIGGDHYYFDPATGKKVTGVRYISTKRPTATGIMLLDLVEDESGTWYDFGENGLCNGIANGVYSVTLPVVGEDGKVTEKTVSRLFIAGDLATGLVDTDDGKKYYADPTTGALATDTTIKVDDVFYTFDESGVAGEVTGWYEDEGNTYYTDKVNGLASGLTVIDGTYYYFDTATNALKKNFWSTDYNMYFGADGKAANGMLENVTIAGDVKTRAYFINGVLSAGTVEKDGHRYTFESDGLTYTDIDLAAAEVAVTIFKDSYKDVLNFKTNIGARFEYVVPNYADYAVKVYDSEGNEITATNDDGNIVITVDAISGYTEFTVKYEPTGEHDWEYHEELSTKATCMYPGTAVYVCKDCGKKKSEPTPIDTEMGHKFTEFDGTYCTDPTCDHKNGCWRKIDETCTEDGYRYTYCTECNKNLKYEIINAAHDWDYSTPIVVLITPVCNQEGLGLFKCKNCDETTKKKFNDSKYHEGTITEVVKKPVTCISEGVKECTCSKCGDSWTEIIPVPEDKTALHAWKKDQLLSAATCYTKVDKYTYYCELCGARKEDTETVTADKWIHDYDGAEMLPPTCGTPGKLYCNNYSDCHHYEEIPATGNHIFEETYTWDSTAHWFKCKNCDEIADYAQHTLTWTEQFDEAGNSTGHIGTCTCGYETDLTAHTLVMDGENAKLFTDATSHWNECSVCGAKLNKADHAFEPKKDATHHWEECTVCGEIKNKAEHAYNEWAYDDAQHWKVCSCGATTDKVDHAFSDEYSSDEEKHWFECECGCKKDVAAHDYEDKFDETNHWKECKDCQKKIEMTAHTLEAKHDETHHWHECSGCDYVSEKTAHNKVKITDAVEATCTHPGNSEGLWCEDCGLVFEEVVTYGQLAHDVINTWISGEGGHYHACRNCSTKLDFTGHTFPDEFVKNDKEHKKTCTVCGARSDDSGAHVYPETGYINLDDENGTATGVCSQCGHTTAKTIETWYAKLGMTKVDGKYYYSVDGENVKNMFVRFSDGLRYFDADGALVLTYTANGIYSMTFKKSADINGDLKDRGVIDTAVLECNGLLGNEHKTEGTYYIKDGEFQTNTLLNIMYDESKYNVYYFDEYGLMVKGKYVDIENDDNTVSKYWFAADGKGYLLVDEDHEDTTTD